MNTMTLSDSVRLFVGMMSVCLCLLFSETGFSARTAESLQPNIIFMMADDLGWADVDFHGGNVPTPHLSKLLKQGVELRQHYVAPVCSPTRTGLMTGRYWSRFGITTPTNTLALPRETVTLPKLLRDAGYETALTGKWHLGSLPKWGPNHFGFDFSYGSMAGGVTPWSHFYKKGPYTTTWHRNEKLISEEGHVTDLITEEAIRRIKTCTPGKPLFLYVPFTAVHLPIREPEKWLKKVPSHIKGDVPQQYAACILHLDDAVGRIVSAVDQLGQSENTLIVFTSDNGGSTAENNDTKYPDDNCPNGRLPGSNEPLRGKKGDLYEGGTRVPTIVRWTGKLKAGSVFESPVHIVDWMPTFCALGRVAEDAKPANWDGVDIWPALSDGKPLQERSLYSAGVGFRSRALRHGDWKLIVFANNKKTQGREELFNISEDPNESNSLAESMPDKLAEMKNALNKISAKDRDAVAMER